MTLTGDDRVVVIGQGYVGLPIALRAVGVGYHVVGFDVDKDRVDRLRRAETFIDDVSDADLAGALHTARYTPTDDIAELAGFRTAVVCVPTPLRDGSPDLHYVEDAARLLAPHLTRGTCVVLESTSYPGTTEEVFGPILEAGSGLRAGADFHLGYSPERIDPSNPTWGLQNTPKIVSGIDDASTAAVTAFYDGVVDHIVPAPGTREAELAKLLENTFRHVNIALVNELAVYCHELGIDVWSVIDMAATKPFGSIDTPAVGGEASGPNFGWALTPNVNGAATCRIPSNGVQVSIDSGPLQPVVYGDTRTDVAGAFPGFSNSDAPGGHFEFDWSRSRGPLATGA